MVATTATPPKRFSLTAPPPRVELLPDSLFFVRVIPIAEAATAADVTTQVELALESLAPFPLAQLYYAHHWVPGARQAVVYAAYRKRFTNEQVDAWSQAEIVIPTFAALLTVKVERASTMVLTTEQGITFVHWEGESGVPSAVITRPWVPDMAASEKRLLREEILRSLGGSRSVIEIDTPPVIEGNAGSSSLVFRVNDLEAPYTREQLDQLDVRDKGELSSRRTARTRDLLLWRAFLACVAGVVLAGLLEVGVVAGRFWNRSRQAIVETQAPAVAEIQRAQTLATRIEELSTKRLRPLEMVTILSSKRPASILFARATTTGTFSMEVEAYTNAPGDVSNYQAALRQMAEIAKVDVQMQGIREGTSVFRIQVTFKPEAFVAAKS
jgi:hypothetical protein